MHAITVNKGLDVDSPYNHLVISEVVTQQLSTHTFSVCSSLCSLLISASFS